MSHRRVDPSTDPFRSGFLNRMDERDELARRMRRRLDGRARLLLYLWYVADLPVSRVAGRIGVSRVHCYRLRDRALNALAEAPPNASNFRPREREKS